MLLGFPKKFLKASTVVWISAGVTPDASNTCGAAEAAVRLNMSVKPSAAIAGKSEVPRRLVVEFFLDFTDFIVLVDMFCFCFGFSGGFVVCAGSCA
jgi:hypothetical protein